MSSNSGVVPKLGRGVPSNVTANLRAILRQLMRPKIGGPPKEPGTLNYDDSASVSCCSHVT